jgi:hypothetical protein
MLGAGAVEDGNRLLLIIGQAERGTSNENDMAWISVAVTNHLRDQWRQRRLGPVPNKLAAYIAKGLFRGHAVMRRNGDVLVEVRVPSTEIAYVVGKFVSGPKFIAKTVLRAAEAAAMGWKHFDLRVPLEEVAGCRSRK